jgi:hypothetical protein
MSETAVPGSIIADPRINYEQVGVGGVQYELYNGGDVPHRFTCWNIDYRIPGREEHWVGKNPWTKESVVYPKKGVLPVWDIPGHGFGSARKLIDFALGKDRRSSNVAATSGIRLLMQDKEKDPIIMAEAQAQYRAARDEQADELIRTWERFVAKCEAAKEPHGPMPVPVRKAYEYRNRNKSIRTDRYKCSICSEGFQKKELMLHHVIEWHEEDHPEAAIRAKAMLPQEMVVERHEEEEEPELPANLRDDAPDYLREDSSDMGADLGQVREAAPDANVAEVEAQIREAAPKSATGQAGAKGAKTK